VSTCPNRAQSRLPHSRLPANLSRDELTSLYTSHTTKRVFGIVANTIYTICRQRIYMHSMRQRNYSGCERASENKIGIGTSRSDLLRSSACALEQAQDFDCYARSRLSSSFDPSLSPTLVSSPWDCHCPGCIPFRAWVAAERECSSSQDCLLANVLCCTCPTQPVSVAPSVFRQQRFALTTRYTTTPMCSARAILCWGSARMRRFVLDARIERQAIWQ
jgi:hypothetical protein